MKRLAVVFAAVAALGLLPGGNPASRAASLAFSSYGADASGTGVHVLSYTNGFTNFHTGFLDNSYPLASAHLDAAPASSAAATVADTGPLGVTGEGQAKPQVAMVSPEAAALVRQPQYAVATYPGQAFASASQGASVAEAAAQQNRAESHAALVAGGADEGSSTVQVDPGNGSVLATATGHADRVDFSNGILVIGGVDVRASVAVEGLKATPHYEVAVTSATVNGTPVMITDKGVVVQDPVPGSDAATQTINNQLNQALAGAGLAVYATAPKVAVSGAQASIEVSGVHVSFVAPQPDPSIPTFTYDYILGEARAFAFGVGSEAMTTGSEPSSSSVDASSSDFSDIGSVSGAVTEVSPTPRTGSLGRPARGGEQSLGAVPASFRRPRPTWLVPIYLIWQALMLATAGVLVWSRREAT